MLFEILHLVMLFINNTVENRIFYELDFLVRKEFLWSN
jgi:hypothetical protein